MACSFEFLGRLEHRLRAEGSPGIVADEQGLEFADAVPNTSGVVHPGEEAGNFFPIIAQTTVVAVIILPETGSPSGIFVAVLSQGFFATQAFSRCFQLLRENEIYRL